MSDIAEYNNLSLSPLYLTCKSKQNAKTWLIQGSTKFISRDVLLFRAHDVLASNCVDTKVIFDAEGSSIL